MKTIALFTLTTITLLFTSCKLQEKAPKAVEESAPIKIETMETAPQEILQYGMFVASKRVNCEGVGARKCLLVRSRGAQVWSNFYDEIEGFDYEEGYEYHLEVKQITVANPPADASAFKYVLVNQLAKEKKESDTRKEFEKKTFEGQWNLVQLYGKDVSSFKATLLFADEKVSAYSGCNRMLGMSFLSTDKTIAISPNKRGPSTLMGCPDGHIENEYFGALEKMNFYKATEHSLAIFDTEGDILFELKR